MSSGSVVLDGILGWPEKDVVGFHLGVDNNPSGLPTNSVFLRAYKSGCRSSLTEAFREANLLNGRFPDGGLHPCAGKPGLVPGQSLLGLFGYLVVLEQLGKCYVPKGNAGTSIVKALKYFPHDRAAPLVGMNPRGELRLSDDEAEAIYALRCALAHEYGLFNRNDKRRERQHRFRVGGTNRVVELPKERWNGDLSDRRPSTLTRINPLELATLVGSTLHLARLLAQDGCLQCQLPGGSRDIVHRFFYRVRVRESSD